MSDGGLRARVTRLARDAQDGSLLDRALRDRCRGELADLRQVWRRNPTEFTPELVGMLQRVAQALAPTSGAEADPPRAPARRSAVGDPVEALRSTFGYSSFRPGQREIIDAVLAGRDCLGVMPTGAGKSITYQLPARMLGKTALVVSPLIALMKDQVDGLLEYGVRATYLNSSLDLDERRDRVQRLRRGEYELVYAAPEGLQAAAGWALESVNLSLIAVDEAHCISQWGHDFRPAYRALWGLKRRLGEVPILALTATATDAVIKDIMTQLGMVQPALFRGSFFRKNLRVHALKKGGGGPSTRDRIVRYVLGRPGDSGIVYCLSRKATEATAKELGAHGVRAAAYHAGLDPEERARVQDGFRNDTIDVVAATIAFGMGIDKSNVRYVIHRDMPRSVEGYYQEIGRAGRDGLPSDCVMFYSWSDVMSVERMSHDDRDASERASQQVRDVFTLAESAGCRHQRLCGWFGEQVAACGDACDACGAPDPWATAPARARKPKDRPAPAPLPDVDARDLLTALKALRRQIASERRIPGYLVFSDATLVAMASAAPRDDDELLTISGVGPKKLERYGAQFLALIREHTA